MHLIIDNYGVQIEVQDGLFQLTMGGIIKRLSPHKLASINILKPCNISTPALVLAAEHQVPVLIYSRTGRVKAWIGSPAYTNIADIRKAQVYFCDSAEGLAWVKQLLLQKNEGQIACLTYLGSRRKEFVPKIATAIAAMRTGGEKLLAAQTPDQIRGCEGNIARSYWEIIADILAGTADMTGRVHQNPPDIANAAINYAYGILYGIVESCLLQVGLDPYMGILHANRHQQPALAFDHIEPFRPWADEVVLGLILDNQLLQSQLQLNEENLHRLDKVARRLIIDTFLTKMEERSYLNEKRIKNKDHILHLSTQLVAKLKIRKE